MIIFLIIVTVIVFGWVFSDFYSYFMLSNTVSAKVPKSVTHYHILEGIESGIEGRSVLKSGEMVIIKFYNGTRLCYYGDCFVVEVRYGEALIQYNGEDLDKDIKLKLKL